MYNRAGTSSNVFIVTVTLGFAVLFMKEVVGLEDKGSDVMPEVCKSREQSINFHHRICEQGTPYSIQFFYDICHPHTSTTKFMEMMCKDRMNIVLQDLANIDLKTDSVNNKHKEKIKRRRFY